MAVAVSPLHLVNWGGRGTPSYGTRGRGTRVPCCEEGVNDVDLQSPVEGRDVGMGLRRAFLDAARLKQVIGSNRNNYYV